MNEKKNIEKFIEQVFRKSKADETSIMITGEKSALTRFSENEITQNVKKTEFPFSIRLKKNGKVGKIDSSSMEDDNIDKCLKTAMEIAKNSNKSKSLGVNGRKIDYKKVINSYKNTENITPMKKANLIKSAITLCKKNKLKGAGILSSAKNFVVFATSKGTYAYHEATVGEFSISVMGKNSSGWAERIDADFSNLNIKKLTEIAIDKALMGKNPKAVKPGKYTVILEPAAVADLISFLAYSTFNTGAYIEGRSFLTGKMNTQICNKKVTLSDDPYLKNGSGIPFDFEGYPRKAVTLIDRGKAVGVVTNRKTAKKLNMKNTGHSLGADEPFGPIPLNLHIHKGNDNISKMIKSTKRGILVTRLHYVNILNPMNTLITGMTRNGTFLIENGKVCTGVKNFRFTQSIMEALNNIEMIGDKSYVQSGGFWGGFNVPAMKIKNFNFTSLTEF